MEPPKSLLGVIAGALLLAACATGITKAEETAPLQQTTVTELSPDISASAQTQLTTIPSETTSTTSDRPVAPDFTLELGNGGTYTLSEGEKPVYLVFWAEW